MNFRLISLICYLYLGSSLSGFSQKTDRDILADGKLSILALGNSFSRDAIEQNLYELCEAEGIEAVIGNLYIGGCSLEQHWKNAQADSDAYEYIKIADGVKTRTPKTRLSNAIADEDWDIITFQQASGVSGIYSTYDPYLTELIEYVSDKSDADLWFHQTWSYSEDSDHSEFPNYNNNQMEMYQAICQAAIKTLEDHPQLVGVIPSGTAIQNGRTSFLGDTFNRDGYHLENNYGRYTVACTWFESLTGIPVEGNSYNPTTVTGDLKAVAQKAAHLAVERPFEISKINRIIYIKPALTTK